MVLMKLMKICCTLFTDKSQAHSVRSISLLFCHWKALKSTHLTFKSFSLQDLENIHISPCHYFMTGDKEKKMSFQSSAPIQLN